MSAQKTRSVRGHVDVLPSGRTWTHDVRTESGKTISVKRCCNGCGRRLGDVRDGELAAAIAGKPQPDVRSECGCSL